MIVKHELPLISTIATGLSLAFICGMIASRLRISPIVGYLVAGIVIGPYSPLFVADLSIAEELSEIGIVLLMFGVGLHFSFKDLMEVRRISLPGALAQIVAATGLGVALTHFWGWSLGSGLVFGLALSVASTVVLLRALEERGLLQTTDGRIAIGWLIVEDLAMVMALVLIPALAVPAEVAADPGSAIEHLFLALGKVALFISLTVIIGRKALPSLLVAVTRTRSRELFTLAVFAMAVGIAFSAAKLFDVSFALGAFFAGMMLRGSDLNHEVADRALPFQEAFAVLFFVAVGMLFNPGILLDKPLEILAVVGIITLGKSLAGCLIVMSFGYPTRTALLVSAGLAQIGEFSFILVNMGLAYGLLPEEGRDIVLASALISIALNPAAFRIFDWIGNTGATISWLSKLFNAQSNDLAHLDAKEQTDLKNHVVLVGYGRVGKYFSRNILGIRDLVIIDANRERVELLRRNGYHAIAGDGGHARVLQEVGISDAVAIVVAVPDSFEAGRIVEAARAANPDIKVLVRAHNEAELTRFTRQKADLVISGPQEVGRRMAEYIKSKE